MLKMLNEEKFSALVGRIEEHLDRYTKAPNPLAEAMRYSLLAGGKRIRPVLLIEFASFAGVDEERAMPFACGLEMIHTYSLIHDDLPCMDNDDLRRGKPTSHRKYGEAAAVLAGDGLLTDAFVLMLGADGINPEYSKNAVLEIAKCAGSSGMTGGQADDTLNISDKKVLSLTELDSINDRKTGAMIRASCRAGLILGGVSNLSLIAAADVYAANLGRAFQITDDILDVKGGKTMGKAAGSDKKLGKQTYVNVLGIEAAEKKTEVLTTQAINALDAFKNVEFLVWLTKSLCRRTN